MSPAPRRAPARPASARGLTSCQLVSTVRCRGDTRNVAPQRRKAGLRPPHTLTAACLRAQLQLLRVLGELLAEVRANSLLRWLLGRHLFYGVQGQKLGIVVAGYQCSSSSRDHSAAIAEHSRGSRARVTGRIRVSARCDFLLSAGVVQLPVYTSCLLRELLQPQMPGLAGVELRFKFQARNRTPGIQSN
jgi:hypothetical protein